MAVFRLDKRLRFPDPHLGEEDGLVAVGGDLSVDRLILAYSIGFFPWFSFRDQKEPLWYCPLQRFVIFPEEIHVSHSMRQLMKKTSLRVTATRKRVRGWGPTSSRRTRNCIGRDLRPAWRCGKAKGWWADCTA